MAQGDRERRNSTAGNPCSFTTAFAGAHGAGHQYCHLKSSAHHNSNWFANQQPNHSANLAILQGHSSVLPNHSSVLPNHSQYLPNHTWQYLTHSGMTGRKCHNQEGERIQVGTQWYRPQSKKHEWCNWMNPSWQEVKVNAEWTVPM